MCACRQGAGDQHASLLPPGEVLQPSLAPAREADLLERAGNSCPVGRPVSQSGGARFDRQPQPRRPKPVSRRPRERCGTRATWCQSEVRQRNAVELDGTARKFGEPEDRPHEGGLSGPIGTEQCDELPGLNCEGHAVEDSGSVEGDHEIVGLHSGRCVSSHQHFCPCFRVARLVLITDS